MKHEVYILGLTINQKARRDGREARGNKEKEKREDRERKQREDREREKRQIEEKEGLRDLPLNF